MLPVVSKVTGEEVEQHVAFEEFFKEEFSEDEEEGAYAYYHTLPSEAACI